MDATTKETLDTLRDRATQLARDISSICDEPELCGTQQMKDLSTSAWANAARAANYLDDIRHALGKVPHA